MHMQPKLLTHSLVKVKWKWSRSVVWPHGSSVHGIFQARVLEWVAISFSNKSLRDKLGNIPKPETPSHRWGSVLVPSIWVFHHSQEMLLWRAAYNLAESRYLKAVDPSGTQTCPVLFPYDLHFRVSSLTKWDLSWGICLSLMKIQYPPTLVVEKEQSEEAVGPPGWKTGSGTAPHCIGISTFLSLGSL